MKLRHLAFSLAISVLLASCGGQPEQPESEEIAPVGVSAELMNAVTVQGYGEEETRPAFVGADIFFLDEIVSAADSWLKIDLRDNRVFSVGENTRVRVDEFVYDPETNASDVVLAITRGAFRFASDTRDPDNEGVSFTTPTAAIGIRGTFLEGLVGPEAVEFLLGLGANIDPEIDPELVAMIVLRDGAIFIETETDEILLNEPGQAIAVLNEDISEPFYLPIEADAWLWDRLPPENAPAPAPVDPQEPSDPSAPVAPAGATTTTPVPTRPAAPATPSASTARPATTTTPASDDPLANYTPPVIAPNGAGGRTPLPGAGSAPQRGDLFGDRAPSGSNFRPGGTLGDTGTSNPFSAIPNPTGLIPTRPAPTPTPTPIGQTTPPPTQAPAPTPTQDPTPTTSTPPPTGQTTPPPATAPQDTYQDPDPPAQDPNGYPQDNQNIR